MAVPRGPFCQSCGMPLQKAEDFGDNADGSRNADYCHFCFQKGSFTEPNVSMDEMVTKVAGFMAQMQNVPEEQAKSTAASFIPQLKRWRRSAAQ